MPSARPSNTSPNAVWHLSRRATAPSNRSSTPHSATARVAICHSLRAAAHQKTGTVRKRDAVIALAGLTFDAIERLRVGRLRHYHRFALAGVEGHRVDETVALPCEDNALEQ